MTVWMDTAKPGRKPRTSRRIILVLGVSAIVIASAFAVWVLFVRPRTLAEVYGFGRWSPGSAVAIEGTITSIVRENTSYGPEVYLGLDGGSECPSLSARHAPRHVAQIRPDSRIKPGPSGRGPHRFAGALARLRCAAVFARVRGVFRVPDRRRHALAGRRRFSERLAALRRHERRRARRRRRSAG